MQRRPLRPIVSALALTAATALLTGCFTLEATITVNDDATADLDYLITIDTERLQEFAGMLGEETGELDELSGDALVEEFFGGDDPCEGLTEDLSDYEITTREIDEDGNVGVGCTVSNVPVAELNSLGDDTSSFSIEQDDTGTRFEAVLEDVDELAGDPAETDEMTDMLGLNLDDLFTIKFIVTAPGSLGENNASSTSGSTATWDIKPDADFVTDGDATLRAEWTPGGGDDGSALWGIILVVVGAIAVAAVLGAVLMKRSKGVTATDPGTDGAPMATPMAPPSSTPPPPPPTVTDASGPPPVSTTPPPPPPAAPPASPPAAPEAPTAPPPPPPPS